MSAFIKEYVSEHSITIDSFMDKACPSIKLSHYLDDVLSIVMSEMEKSYDGVRVKYDLTINHHHEEPELDVYTYTLVRHIEFTIKVSFHLDQNIFRSINHLKLKYPDILELLDNRTSVRQQWVDILQEHLYSDCNNISFQTLLGFTSDQYFNTASKQ